MGGPLVLRIGVCQDMEKRIRDAGTLWWEDRIFWGAAGGGGLRRLA